MSTGATADEWESLRRSHELLASISDQIELCRKVDAALDMRIGEKEIINRLFVLESWIGNSRFSGSAKSFQREVKQTVGTFGAGGHHEAYIGIVATVLEYYMASGGIDVTAFQEVYNLAMEPLDDFIALSTRTNGDPTLQEVALSLLETLKGSEAVDLAYGALYGTSEAAPHLS